MARIVFELEVDASPGDVAQALSTQEGIAGWWTADATVTPGEGGRMELGFPIAPQPFELTIDEVGADRVRWTSVGEFPPHWKGTTVEWTLFPADGGTKVHFSHDGWASDEGAFPGSALTWARLMDTLKAHAETGASAPLFAQR